MFSISRCGFTVTSIAFCSFLLFFESISLSQEANKDGRTTSSTGSSRQMPDWLSLGGSLRLRTEGRTGIGFTKGADDAYFLSRLRLDVGIKATPWLNLFVQGQDSRSPGNLRSNSRVRDPLDLRQAYFELADPARRWIKLKVGRQELRYGTERVISPGDWGNVTRTFDAAKLTLGDPDTNVDIFAASVVQVDVNALNKRRDGDNLYGIYAQMKRLLPNATVEPFLLYKTMAGGSAGAGAHLYTAGARLAARLPANFDFSTKLASQTGSSGTDTISAWAGYWIIGYTMPATLLSPRFLIEYAHASGDRNAFDGRRETFDPLFPSPHADFGIADLVGWRNVRDFRTGIELTPSAESMVRASLHSFWLASRMDHFYNPVGQIVASVPPGGSISSKIGNELDISWTYRPVPKITLGAGWARLFPGRFLKLSTPGAGSSYAYLFFNYTL